MKNFGAPKTFQYLKTGFADKLAVKRHITGRVKSVSIYLTSYYGSCYMMKFA
jgi:hypothetical protein